MPDKNKEIKNYLQYYLKMKNSPQYAIMLKGLWGSGKTWFIKKFINELKSEEIKILYISLYGITETQQIEDAFFRQLHPVLSSKGTELAGRILKGFVKGTLKIDFNNDSKSDARANIGIPDLNLPEYLRNTNRHVLVFDDLERCALPIAEVLGYINFFVEHDGQKVIIICNEEVIVASHSEQQDTTDRSYTKIKEKLIGKTFEIEPDFAEATQTFIGEIGLDSTKDLLTEHCDIVKRIYINANYKNLRHLRQAILDFARMVEILDMRVRKKTDLMAHLLSFFLIYSFEIKSGTILPSQIKSIDVGLFRTMTASQDETENLYTKLSSKYGDIQILDTLLTSEIWQSIFHTGLFDAEEINQTLNNSRYFPEKNRPDWVTLWHMHHLSDSELETAIKIVDKRFQEKNISDLGELKHIVSSFMLLSNLGIYKKKRKEITELGLGIIQKMHSNGTLATIFSNHIKLRSKTAYNSLGYHEIDSKDFSIFLKKVDEIGISTLEENYPNDALQMLELLKTNTNQFVAELLHNNYIVAKYANIPILSFIDQDKFVQTLQEISPKQLYQISHMIVERYSSGHYRQKLKIEKDWLLRIIDRLDTAHKERAGKMSGHILHGVRNSFISGVKLFEGDA